MSHLLQAHPEPDSSYLDASKQLYSGLLGREMRHPGSCQATKNYVNRSHTQDKSECKFQVQEFQEFGMAILIIISQMNT